jgi:Uma2 family endonuclease
MSASRQPRLTPEQYLAIERAAEFRSEYYDGHMYAMSGGSYRHAIIIANLIRRLGNALEQGPCTVVSNDLRMRVSPAGLYAYPDVIVVCGPPKLSDSHNDTLENPTFLAEVLSASTEAYDRGLKSSQYRKIESLQEYALISQDEPRVEVYRRQPSGDWLLSECAGLDAVCRFASLDCQIALAAIYAKVTFGGEDGVPGR